MVQHNQVYKCNLCGNIVEVVHAGGGQLVCCGQNMQLLEENTTEAATEKHIPVIEQNGSTVVVKVGSVLHPMEEKHYIEFIELIADGKVYRKNLTPSDAPQAEFEITANELTARAYCNLHGFWKS